MDCSRCWYNSLWVVSTQSSGERERTLMMLSKTFHCVLDWGQCGMLFAKVTG